MILRIAAAVPLLCIGATMASPIDQIVLAPDNFDDFIRPDGNLPALADLLTLETRASIFYSYSRETDMSARFSQKVGPGEGTTLFVPTNKAIQALARKPHQDPDHDTAGMSDAEHDAISLSNVQRWVGAHIVPSPNVNFSSLKPYNTLTPGATIIFKALPSTHGGSHPSPEPHIDIDAAHHTFVKGSTPHVDTDAAHFATIKGLAGVDVKASHPVDTGTAHVSNVKGTGRRGTCPRVTLRKGLALARHVDTDAAHFSAVKGSVSSDRASQPELTTDKPIWERYELNDGVRIITEKQASNGVMYIIDGTVSV